MGIEIRCCFEVWRVFFVNFDVHTSGEVSMVCCEETHIAVNPWSCVFKTDICVCFMYNNLI